MKLRRYFKKATESEQPDLVFALGDKMIQIKPNKQKALYLAKRQISVLVYDAIQLEGINYTLPEVQTLLDGITIGGHKVSDQQVVINQHNAWQELFKMVKDNTFKLDKATACKIHSLSGKDDALKWGCFRDGEVTIAGTNYLPPKAEELDSLFDNMIKEVGKIDNIYDKASYIFLDMSRNQYFFDINKRTGRFMMNGLLLSNGYPVINVQAKDRLEFNTLMLEFYETNNQKRMNKFLKYCINEQDIKFMNSIDKQQNKG